MTKIIGIFFIGMFMVILSCERQSNDRIGKAAEVNSKIISLASVDSAISDKLYLRLYDIYYIRKIALDILIEEELLSEEATNRNLSIDSLLAIEVYNKLTKSSIEELILNNNLQNGIPDSKHPGRVFDPTSFEGEEYLEEVFFRKTRSEFVESLKLKYKITSYLKPPLTKKIELENLLRYSLNDNSFSTKILIVSDFECPACRDSHNVLNELITKYNDKVSFYFTPFSNTVNYSMLFFECISNDSNSAIAYKSMFETVLESKIDYVSISKSLNKDIDQINDCIQKNEAASKKINQSIEILKTAGIVQTPTLIIDGRVYYGEFDILSISEYIDLNTKK